MVSHREAAGAGLQARWPRPSLLSSSLLCAFALVFLHPSGASEALAQGSEWVGSAEAPIHEDNLDVAKRRAVRGAQRNAIERLLEEMVVREWLELFASEIRRRVLRRPSRFVSAYRVRRLEASMDRTRYFATLAAQVNRELLVRELHALGLPVKGEPQKRVLIFYSAADPLFGPAAFRDAALPKLKNRLELLNLQITGVVRVAAPEAARLGNPFGDALARGEWLSRRRTAAGLFLASRQEDPETEGGGPVTELYAHLFQAGNGVNLGTFSVRGPTPPPGQSETARAEKALATLFGPLTQQLQPGSFKPFGPTGGKTAPLKLRVLGFASVEEEEKFAPAFFRRGSRFERFVLTRLDRESVTYRGDFTGERRELEAELRGKTFGEFTIEEVFWFNGVLELVVKRSGAQQYSDMKLFP